MRILAGILLGLVFVAALGYATLQETGVQCRVCVSFNGVQECRTGSGSDRDTAVRGAVATACAMLSSGVTQGIRCDRTRPDSVVCE